MTRLLMSGPNAQENLGKIRNGTEWDGTTQYHSGKVWVFMKIIKCNIEKEHQTRCQHSLLLQYGVLEKLVTFTGHLGFCFLITL